MITVVEIGFGIAGTFNTKEEAQKHIAPDTRKNMILRELPFGAFPFYFIGHEVFNRLAHTISQDEMFAYAASQEGIIARANRIDSKYLQHGSRCGFVLGRIQAPFNHRDGNSDKSMKRKIMVAATLRMLKSDSSKWAVLFEDFARMG